jgi:4-hydroxy-tetrahydrodipicolinate reductase
MMRALLIGYGKKGHLIAHLAPQYGIAISGVVDANYNTLTNTLPQSCVGYSSLTQEAIDSCDIAIDFASSKDICQRILLLSAAQKPIVIGTTGWEKNEQEAKKIIKDTMGALLYSPNFSLGIALFSRLVSHASELFSAFPQYDVGILETHHRQKQDAPSGTGLALANTLMRHYPERKLTHELSDSKGLDTQEIHLSSHRSGFHPGTHEVSFDSAEDTISLTHRARSREGFARGALESAFWLLDKKGWYTLDDMIEEKIYAKFHKKR